MGSVGDSPGGGGAGGRDSGFGSTGWVGAGFDPDCDPVLAGNEVWCDWYILGLFFGRTAGGVGLGGRQCGSSLLSFGGIGSGVNSGTGNGTWDGGTTG